MKDRGLDGEGYIRREGDLARVPEAFAPVVRATRSAIIDGYSRLHSAYLYGSIPRGTARPGVSDLDVLIVLHGEPGDADTQAARNMESALDREFPQIDGAGILLSSAATVLSERERDDMGWFVACLCTPLTGEDLGTRLPRYRPTSQLARQNNNDLGDLLPRWRDQLTRTGRRTMGRRVGRRLVRTGFTLVMPRWGGWTSDLDESADVFGHYYPARRDQMRTAAAIGRSPQTASAETLGMLIDGLGPWLAAEYLAVHGPKE